ncbi:MAG TPA: electron transport complex protein RnfC, partial [Candidatus Aminicenantes bacterium]|nr:electron transport complex protein RnfC [Candidatus Aminicenantes bacterium]
ADLKRALLARGGSNPHHRAPATPHGALADRKVPSAALRRKIGLAGYAQETPQRGRLEPQRVRVPLRRQAGAAARACVAVGSRVKRGDLVGAPPPDKLGACVHASIAGRVTDVTEDWVEILAT